jgi:UDP-2-acetamido-2-deoxy-ribo-hexuluronate aminotransferase
LIPINDVKLQYFAHKDEIDETVQSVLNGGQYINGAEVVSFAEHLGSYLGVKHVIPCGNGTDALTIALLALNLDKDDEVIVPAFGYAAAVEVVLLLNLKPVFVDINPSTFNIDVTNLRGSISSRTKVIIPIHLFGQCADMIGILGIAQQYNLFVVEDAAQSMGSKFNFEGTNHMSGTMGNIGCTSFFPSKNLSCFGDGGAVFTNDDHLASKIKMIANHGQNEKYHHQFIGLNSRLDTIQAAILNVNLKYLEDNNSKRQLIADRYSEALTDIKDITLPKTISLSTHVYHQYSIMLSSEYMRDDLKQYLKRFGISSIVYYPKPLNKQEAYFQEDEKNFENAEKVCRRILSLPIYPDLSLEDQHYVTKSISAYF